MKLPANRRPVRRLAHAFKLLYAAMSEAGFRKSRTLTKFSERELLLPVRFFLLGIFYEFEAESKIMISESGKRFDFLLKGNVAVEFAVIRRCINFKKHQSEITKLKHHNGRGAYVIFDFSENPPGTKRLKTEFRKLYDNANGENVRPIQIIYYFRGPEAECGIAKFGLGPKSAETEFELPPHGSVRDSELFDV
jgi:hypothetical protein